MSDSVPTSSSPRNLEQCPSCDYLLNGLPDAGRCPECGSECNQEVIVLYGWGGNDGDGNQSPRRGWMQMAAIWGPTALFSLMVFWFSPWLCLLPAAGATIASLAVRYDMGAAPPVKLALHASGWTWAYSVTWADRLRLYRIGAAGIWLTPCVFWIYALRAGVLYPMAIWTATLAGSILWRWVCRYFRKRGLSASGHRADPRWTPWAAVNRLTVTQNKRGKWRIHLGVRGVMKHLRSGPYRRDFSLECELPEARREHLLRQIATWPVDLRIERAALPH